MIEAIGSNVLLMSPAEHDRVVAWTSHLPQLASTALAATAGEHLESPEQYRAGDGRGGYLVFLGRMAAEKAPHLAIDAAHAAGLPIRLA